MQISFPHFHLKYFNVSSLSTGWSPDPLPALWTLAPWPTQVPHHPDLHLMFSPSFCVFTEALPLCLSLWCSASECLLVLQNPAEHQLLQERFPYFLRGSLFLRLLWLGFILVLLMALITQHCSNACTSLLLFTINSLRAEVICSFIFISLVPGTSVEMPRFSVDCVLCYWWLLEWGRAGDGGGGKTFLPRVGQTEGMRRKGLSFSSQDFFLEENCPLTSSVNKVIRKERFLKNLWLGSSVRLKWQSERKTGLESRK